MPANPALPNPAATLPGEADVLANVLTDLSDHDAKLVYADWLEDRDDKRGPLLRNFVTAFQTGKKLPKTTSTPKPWRDLVGITLLVHLRTTEFAPWADRLLALARPTLAFKSARAPEHSLPVGASKFGGRPDLPPGTRWPYARGKPLAFLGQFNSADLHASPAGRDLPDAGVLSVFFAWHPENSYKNFGKESWRLFYFPDAAELARREPPDDSLAPPFRTCRLAFTETLTLPDDSWQRREGELRLVTREASMAYRDLTYPMYSRDCLLGYPHTIHRDVLGKKGTRHLLSVWDNARAGWFLGIVQGALYFTLGEDDLKQRRFDRVQMQMQHED